MTAPHFKIQTAPAADRDLENIVDHLYYEAGYNTVLSFLAAFEKTLTTIATLPHSGRRSFPHLQRTPDLRRLPISKPFGDWLLFYRVTSTHIEIVRILHGKQNWPSLLR